MWAPIDLTGSDDEEITITTVQRPTQQMHQSNRTQQSILAAALARAGGASFSGNRRVAQAVRAPQSRAPTMFSNQSAAAGSRGFNAGVDPSAPQGLYAAPGCNNMHNSLYYSVITCSIASQDRFKLVCESQLAPAALTYLRRTAGASQNADGIWELPLREHTNFTVAMHQERVMCDQIPQTVLSKLAAAQAGTASDVESGRMDEDGYAKGDDDDEHSISDIPRTIWNKLAPFQREGVGFMVRHNGRILLADEPGLGKTIQAIGGACAYYHEWPVLVISPSSARFHWCDEFKKWLPDPDYLPPESVHVITSEKMAAREFVEHAKVLVTSYDLMHREGVQKALQRVAPQVVICDECHYLKNGKARRTKAILPLVKQARRAFLLSGTPALSRPIELFWQLHGVDPEAWPDVADFTRRYCSGRKGKAGDDGAKEGDSKYSAASNLAELHTLLSASLMLRRNKKKILTTLLPKRRLQRRVQIEDPVLRRELKEDLEEFRSRSSELAELANAAKNGGAHVHRAKPKRVKPDDSTAKAAPVGADGLPLQGEAAEEHTRKEMASQKKALLMELFRKSGAAKLPAIARRVTRLLYGAPDRNMTDQEKADFKGSLDSAAGEDASDKQEPIGKLLIFAHHRVVLDALAVGCLKDIPYVRIDGCTPAKDRQNRVVRFQTDPACRVALLGITAAGVALTLTAASHVIFTELYWTPAALVQAEDRAHRIGQTSEVIVEYILADDCVDDILWPCIQHKMLMLGELFDDSKTVKLDSISIDERNNTKKKVAKSSAKLNATAAKSQRKKRDGDDAYDDSDSDSDAAPDAADLQNDLEAELEELNNDAALNDPDALDIERDDDKDDDAPAATNARESPPDHQRAANGRKPASGAYKHQSANYDLTNDEDNPTRH